VTEAIQSVLSFSIGTYQNSMRVSEKVSLNKPIHNKGPVTRLQRRVSCRKVVKAYEIRISLSLVWVCSNCLDLVFVVLVALEGAQYSVKRVKKEEKYKIIYSLVNKCIFFA
jgi:hypothetical protein